MDKLDRSILDSDISFVSLGHLSQEMIDFIASKNQQLGDLLSTNRDILFWKDRIKHTELHKKDFLSDNLFYTCLEDIPIIIQEPDYISIHPKDNSISFIRDYSQHVSVAIRVSVDGKLSYRTMYPLMDAQLSHYLEKNRAWRYDKNI